LLRVLLVCVCSCLITKCVARGAQEK